MITENDWRAIEEFVSRMVSKVGEPFVQGRVTKVDAARRVVFLKEFGDTPIPVVTFDHDFKWSDITHTNYDPLHYVGDPGEPAFGGAWTNYGSGFDGAAFYKNPFGHVYLSGLVKSGTGAIFNLPAGYRPAASLLFSVHTGEPHTFGRIDVAASGAITQASGNNGYVSLSTVQFRSTTPAKGQTHIKNNFTTVKMPKKGDLVLVAQHYGTSRLPKCLGIIKGKNFIVTGD